MSHNLDLVRDFWKSDNDSYSGGLKQILETCVTKAERFAKIAELCLPAETPEELYFISKSYVWAGANYRLLAIEYLKKYIEAGAFWEGLPSGIIKMEGYEADQRIANIADAYAQLGNCYEGEYMFSEALECFKHAYSLIPYFCGTLIKSVQIYVKMNDLQGALDLLDSANNNPYYSLPDYRNSIDLCRSEIEEKIKKGYIYKPRKKK